jgi:adenylosuccinate synthase
MSVDVIIGCQAGDEGKGSKTDLLVEQQGYDYVARFNGGANAGHAVTVGDNEFDLHQIPSGILHDGVENIIGNGSLVDPTRLIREEMVDVEEKLGTKVSPKNLKISDTAHVVLPHHLLLDALREVSKDSQGSTIRGIAFVAADKYKREGVRAELITGDPEQVAYLAIKGLEAYNEAAQLAGRGDKSVNPEERFREWWEDAYALKPYIVDTVELLNGALENGARILAEGAQSVGLDIEHGIYPLNTSSHATPAGALNGLGINHHYLDRVIGIAKVTRSRVGGNGGPFVTYIDDPELQEKLRGKPTDRDGEFGKSTGRPRDMGYFDIPELRRAKRVAGLTELVLTKLDLAPRFGDSMKVAIGYDYAGERKDMSPNSADKLKVCKPMYETFPTWQEDISGIRNYDELPGAAKDFVEFVESELTTPKQPIRISILGVGPDRNQVIMR